MNKQRWTREECPYPIYDRKRPRRSYEQKHPIITKWDDFKEEEKQMLLNVKKVITSYLGEKIIRIFGSRINGSWIEESDWDLSVIGDFNNKQLMSTVREHDYGVPIDIQFHSRDIKITDLDIIIP